MQAKIMIKRHFKEGRESEIAPLLNDMRTTAMQQPGYISGVTLSDPDNPRKRLVISTWQRIEDWRSWKENQKRRQLEAMLEFYQEEPTVFEEYVVGVSLQ